ncbi:MAG: glycosyltransferase family 39 protein, partial [Caldilineaceae bacterium]|nr:glycosyltransferase family 39 protein [Caldilineaceae bacterium]
MVKLLWQLGAWSLAFYSIYLWTTADPATPHGIRDGLLVAVVACLLSLRQSNRFALTRTRTLIEQPTAGGQLVLWTGIICLLVGSLMEGQISATPTVALLSGTILWWIGATLLTVAVVWPKAWRNARHPTMVLPENRDTPADGRRAQDDLHDPVAAISQPAPDATGAPVAGRTIPGVNWLSLLLVLLIGSGIRWLIMAQLPAFCVGTACEAALAVSEGMPTSSLPLLIAQWLNPWLDQGFLSVRLATVLLALLGLMSFYLLARRLVSSGGALLGTFLLLLTPWVYTLDAGALPALTLFFWFPLALWLLLTAWQRQQPRWALVGGIALGLATQVPLFQVALLLWLLLLTLLTIFLTKRDITRLLSALLALLGFLISTLPIFIELGGVAALLRDTLRGAPFSSNEWLIALFQPGLLALTQWADLQWVGVPPLTLVLGGATVVGLGALLRNLRDPLAG